MQLHELLLICCPLVDARPKLFFGGSLYDDHTTSREQDGKVGDEQKLYKKASFPHYRAACGVLGAKVNPVAGTGAGAATRRSLAATTQTGTRPPHGQLGEDTSLPVVVRR